MELVMLQDLGLVLEVWAFVCLLVIQGSAGTGLQSPIAAPSLVSVPALQTTKGPPAFTSPNPSAPTPNPFTPPPASAPDPVPFTPPIPPSADTPSTSTPNSSAPPPSSTPDPIPFSPPISPSADTPSTSTPNSSAPPPSSTPDPIPFSPPTPPSADTPSTSTPNSSAPPPSSTPDPIPFSPPISPSADTPSTSTPNSSAPPPSSTPDPIPFSPPIPPSADTPSEPAPNSSAPPPSSTPDPIPFSPPIPPSADTPSESALNPLPPPPPPASDPVLFPPPIPPTATPPSNPTPNPFIPPPGSAPDPVPFTPPITPSANPPPKPTPDPFVPPPASAPNPAPFPPPIPSSVNPPPKPTPNPFIPPPPPSSTPDPVPFTPAPVVPPSSSSPPEKQTHPPVSKSTPPTSHKTIAPSNDAPPSPIAPVSNVPPPSEMPESRPPSHSDLPKEPPSLPPDVSPRSRTPRKSPPIQPALNEPPSSPPVQNASPKSAPPPRIRKKTAATPVVSPQDRITPIQSPSSRFPAEAPTASKTQGHPYNAPPPRQSHSPRPHHSKIFNPPSAPSPVVMPPPSSDPSANGSYSPSPAPSPSNQAKIPSLQPKKSPNMPLLPPLRALPPPPPNTDCAPLTCIEPLAYGPPEAPCVCVLPIQVGLRLSVALYTFFPLVSELASEVAAGVFMKQSQVRIMGANAAEDNTEKTLVLIDLLPLGEKFDDTTAYLTFQRFWHKQVVIKTSIFGDYDVLYVRYPGLPPSPPMAPSTVSIIPSKPYPGHDNNGRTIQPLGVDVSRKQHKHGMNKSILAIIIISCFVAVILVCASAWALLFRDRQSAFRPDPTPPTTLRSLAKSSGIAGSRIESGISSPSFSLGSSMAPYMGSAKTFSSADIDKATDFFNEANVLGEGGFGRVYSGVLEDGAKVAIKILKRYDQQSGREFLAEVEMLSRLHHQNLVKLIGICVEDRTRCIVYELIPNGSVESHLHGIDKERSPLDWGARLKIALGAARALAYLHEDSSPRVIHRDFKASNILLEDDFTPKVSDFGLARAASEEENKHISTRVMGTFGYVAPEYAMTGHLLVKSDVYSYGVVLLELLTGKKPVDMSQQPGHENLVAWARPLLTSREGLESIVDQSVAPNVSFDSIAKVAAIASMCVQPEVAHRPFMGEVVQALKLICSECDCYGEREFASRSCSHEDLSLAAEGGDATDPNSLPATMLSPPSTVSDYDYRIDVDRDLSMSELLSSSKFGGEESESFRRHSSSGPLRTNKRKPLWRSMRRLSRGSVSEHGAMLKLWSGSR